ncbi:hypothetical protein [Spirobacillus cienkowskii]|uniref:hypothetical protein n=1 Tax=Spirobacillus cienkowskii TaxID=495820 RepID=UPI0030CAA597
MQSFAANYLQSIGAEKIKELAPLLGGEGSPGHIALHSVLGCAAGAMADSCGSRAFGAASGVLINTALSSLEDTQNLSAAERENRINIVTSLVAGMSAAAGLGDPNAAMTSARLETENNNLKFVTEKGSYLLDKLADKRTWQLLLLGGATLTSGSTASVAVNGLIILGRAYTAYEIGQDIYDVINGEKTLQQLALEKSEDYVVGLITTKAFGEIVKSVKSGASIVMQMGDDVVVQQVKSSVINVTEANKDKIQNLANSGEEFLQKVKAKGKDSKQIAENLPDAKGKVPDADGKLPGTKEKLPEADGKSRNRNENVLISRDDNQINQQISKPYKRPSNATTQKQRKTVQNQPCVDCGVKSDKMFADHKVPLVKEYYESGGKINLQKMREIDAVQPQCSSCSSKQGAEMSRYSKQKKNELGL